MSKRSDNYAALAAAVGLRYDEANNVLYGQKDGYDIIIYAENASYPNMLTIHTSAKSTDGAILNKDTIKTFVKENKPITRLVQKNNNIIIYLKNQTNLEKLEQAVADSLSAMSAFLRNNAFVPCCGYCGQTGQVSAYIVGSSCWHLCADCEAQMRSNISMAAQQHAQKKENLVGGIVGALLGSLIGAACILLLSQLGYIAALSGVLMAVAALKGYEILGGKLTKKGIVITSIIMLFMTYFGDRLDWAIILYRDAGGAEVGYTFFECYRMVFTAISEGIIDLSSYLTNLMMLYVFVLIGAIPTIVSKVKEKKAAGNMVKIGGYGMRDGEL